MNLKEQFELLKKLDCALLRVKEDEFAYLGEVVNLKMHDAYSYAYEEDLEEYFYDWCSDAYSVYYEDELKFLQVKEVPLHLTSSFRLINENSNLTRYCELNYYDSLDFEQRRLMVFLNFLYSKFDYSVSPVDLDEKRTRIKDVQTALKILDYNRDSYGMTNDEIMKDLKFPLWTSEKLAEEFCLFCKEQLEPVNRMYKFIENFKEKQVEIFKNYLKAQELLNGDE